MNRNVMSILLIVFLIGAVFLVGADGIVKWQGHPMSPQDSTIEQAL